MAAAMITAIAMVAIDAIDRDDDDLTVILDETGVLVT